MRIRKSIRLLILLFFGVVSASQAQTAIRFGKLIDGKGKVWTNAVVLVRDSKVEKVLPSDAVVPSGFKVIDLHQYTGMPGLIDVHTHMTYWWDKTAGTRPWDQLEHPNPGFLVFMAQENALRTLEAGVTTVRDLGSIDYDDIAMRNLIERGAMRGPRMFVAGCGLSVSQEAFGASTKRYCGQADGVPEVLRAVREQVAAGADVIKIYGSTGSAQDVSESQTFTYDEMKAAIDVAHKYGKRVAVHSYGPDGARDAVLAGANSIEHAIDIPDDVLAEMVKRGTFYVPTIDHNRYYVDARADFGYNDKDVVGLNAYIQKNLETARRAHKAGVKIAMGSDAVFTMFGQNTRELAWLVKAGMSPAEALQAATTNGAALLGMPDQLGAVAPGYFADMVAVEGDPLSDIQVAIDKVRWVMKGGQVVVDHRQ